MTIINPTKNNQISKFLLQIFALLLVGGLMYVYLYSELVDNRHAIKNAKESIIAFEVENADLKNQLFTLTDPSGLEIFAAEFDFVFENNPQYLNLSQWISDSSY